MKIIITGSLGHISQPLAQELIHQGHAVTVISSQPDKQAAIEALGATAAIGKLEDVDFVAATFAGADAAYCMIPPNFGAPDARAHYQTIGRSYVHAIRQTGVPRVVHLSSWGADLDQGTGFILGSHDVENLLNELPDVALTHLRAGYLYYNLNNYIGMIKGQGIVGSNYGGDASIVLVAPADIATAAAEELTGAGAPGRTVRYVASDERTPDEIAHVLGAAIGKPDLQWVAFGDAQMQAALERRGMPAPAVASMLALGSSIRSGALRRDYDQHPPKALGKVKLEDFALEFVAAYQKA
ncbi:NAD(P)H-binding protein [Hymenobacter terrestris]|uniref:NAD(P)H-binding protein n=1 Tax=Hymenobacter terrestris TaxID=2748310 RepID=A0ABX2Q9E6_9BACT|nr:NAD(P)H-binding protein [Hymenobacter terrestris]NVO86324.1 NAD(P)H-binding protein [Hymenobacter terrestris]